VNILPIRVRLSADMEFDQLLDQVTSSTQEALEHQQYPFDVLVRRIDRSGGSVVRPFLNVIYAYQSAANVYVDVGDGLPRAKPAGIQSIDFSFDFAKAELCLNVFDYGPQGLGLTLEYDSELFTPATMKKYLGTLERFARSIAV